MLKLLSYCEYKVNKDLSFYTCTKDLKVGAIYAGGNPQQYMQAPYTGQAFQKIRSSS